MALSDNICRYQGLETGSLGAISETTAGRKGVSHANVGRRSLQEYRMAITEVLSHADSCVVNDSREASTAGVN